VDVWRVLAEAGDLDAATHLAYARRFDWAELLPGLLRDLALEPG